MDKLNTNDAVSRAVCRPVSRAVWRSVNRAADDAGREDSNHPALDDLLLEAGTPVGEP